MRAAREIERSGIPAAMGCVETVSAIALIVNLRRYGSPLDLSGGLS